MAKKLISYDDEAEGIGLPEVVVEGLNATYVPKSELQPPAGVVAVISDTEPAEPTRGGLPVVWLKTVYNTIPEIDSISLAGDGLTVTASFVGFDADGDTLSYAIDWGDGASTSDAATPATHAYAAEGSYTVTVYVTDQWGATASSTDSIFVVPAIPNRWAFDSFTYPDNTVLAGWVNDTTPKTPQLSTEEGGLTWLPGNSTTGGAQFDYDAVVVDGLMSSYPDQGAIYQGARLEIPEPSCRVAFTYHLPDPTIASTAVSVTLSTTAEVSRSTTGVASFVIRVFGTGRMKAYTQMDGTSTEVADSSIYPIPNSARLEVSYDAATGLVNAWINGELALTYTYTGTPQSAVGVSVRRGSSIDNFEVGSL